MKFKFVIRIALAGIAALLPVHWVSAATVNLPVQSTGIQINGQSCVSISPGMTPIYNQYGIYNPSTTSGMYVTCPVVMPQHYYTILSAIVYVYNRNGADPVYCILGATDYKGENLIYDRRQAAVAQSAVIELGPQISPNVGTFPANSNPSLTCYLPPTTYDNSYLTSAYVSGWFYQSH